jgi:endonuclease III related protein
MLEAKMNPVPVSDSKAEQIRAYYGTLFSAWGRQHWWPAQSRFEVIVGAYLTQNTSWRNVEKAIRSLRKARAVSVEGIRQTPTAKLEKLIRSAGYFRQKAQRLKAFVRFLDQRYAGSLTRMFAQPTAQLREDLLSLNGIGPETADSILLYAGNHPVFVVDAYTRRILERHGMIGAKASYEEIRGLCEDALVGDSAGQFGPSTVAGTANLINCQQKSSPREVTGDTGELAAANQIFPKGTKHRPSRISMARRTALAQVFNEMHGLLVGVGKNYCQKSQMRCEDCPLQKFLPGKS